MNMINLDKNECYILADMIEANLFDMIRKDTDIDSIPWLVSIVHVYEKLREASKDSL